MGLDLFSSVGGSVLFCKMAAVTLSIRDNLPVNHGLVIST